MSTIFLIISYLYLMWTTYSAGFVDVTGILAGLLGLVLVAEYFSVKKTTLTISERIHFSDNKKKPMLAFGLLVIALILHLI